MLDVDSASEFDNDSHPLLSGEKEVLYEEQSRPAVLYAFVRRCPALSPTNTENTSYVFQINNFSYPIICLLVRLLCFKRQRLVLKNLASEQT